MAVSMEQKDITYPIVTYPEIREFAAMLEQLAPDYGWTGIHFWGNASQDRTEGAVRFYFRRRTEGIRFGFSAEEWQTLRGLFATAIKLPRLQAAFAELALIYGEL